MSDAARSAASPAERIHRARTHLDRRDTAPRPGAPCPACWSRGIDETRDGGDRRVGQHRHRSDVQAAPVRGDRAALDGRHRPRERGPGARPRSTGSRPSPRASTGCSRSDELPDIVFEATSAYAHVAQRARATARRASGRSTSRRRRVGPYVIPAVNLTEHLDEMNVNMVTCGGQATIPMVLRRLPRRSTVPYAEIVATVASRSAGPGTRANIDEFTRTTAVGRRGARRRRARQGDHHPQPGRAAADHARHDLLPDPRRRRPRRDRGVDRRGRRAGAAVRARLPPASASAVRPGRRRAAGPGGDLHRGRGRRRLPAAVLRATSTS